MSEEMTAKDWEARYRNRNTPWDLGTVSPPFVRFATERSLKSGKLAIPGCGRGHEGIFFARRGFEVTLFDLAPSACRSAEDAADRAGVELEVVEADVLALPQRYGGRFNYVLEQTFFCALPKQQRKAYVEAVRGLLRHGGLLFGLYFDFGAENEDDDGPPFGIGADALRSLLEPHFEIVRLDPCPDSHPRRAGEELWLEANAR